MSSNPFSVFDNKLAVSRIVVTQESWDTSGNYTAASETTSAIKAHISEVSLNEKRFIDPNIVSVGVRKITAETSVGLDLHDKIQVTELNGDITQWELIEKRSTSLLMNKLIGSSRETFLMKKVS